MEPNTMFHQENKILLTAGSYKSTSSSMIKPTGIISTSMFLQGSFIQYLHKAVHTIVSLQPSLSVSLHDNILCHFYKGICTVVSLLSSLLTALRSEFLWLSLPTSLSCNLTIPYIIYFWYLLLMNLKMETLRLITSLSLEISLVSSTGRYCYNWWP